MVQCVRVRVALYIHRPANVLILFSLCIALVCLTSAMRVHSPASPKKPTPIANEEDTGPIQTCGCDD